MRHTASLLLAVIATARIAEAQTRTPIPPRPSPLPGNVPPGYSILGDTPVVPAGYVMNGRVISHEPPEFGTAIPIGLTSAQAASINGKLYVMGGYENAASQPSVHTWQFDPVSSIWTQKADMPGAAYYGGAAAANGRIYVISGVANSPTVYEYDPLTDSWSSKTPMPTSRHLFGVASVHDRIYVMGGSASPGNDVVEEYDPVSDSWRSRSKMPTPRVSHCVAVVNDRIMVIGGVDSAGHYLKTCEEYDPSNDSWRGRASLSIPRAAACASQVHGTVICVGGEYLLPFNPQWQFPDAVEQYDPETDHWSMTVRTMEPRINAVAADVDGALHVIGGEGPGNPATGYLDVHEILLPTATFYVFKKN